MTFVDAIVVYLSIGAPFGVLQFFSNEGRGLFGVAAKSLAAMLLWPYFAVSWNLVRKKWQKTGKLSAAPDMTVLFEIAGHSNPKLAKICYERGRRRIAEGALKVVEASPDINQVLAVAVEQPVAAATSHP